MTAVALALGLVPAPGRAAGTGWDITLAPSTVGAGDVTPVKVDFSNHGGPDGDQDLGCVRISIPLAFSVLGASVTDEPPDSDWKASTGGLTVVTVNASSGGDRLPPDDPSAGVSATITVTSLIPGTYTWTANAYRSQDCSESFNDPVSLSVVVQLKLLPTPTPTPTPGPTPTPTPLPTPTLSAAPTARPTAEPTTAPTATPASSRAPAGSTSPPIASSAPGSTSDPVPTAAASTAPARSAAPGPVGSAAGSTPPSPPIGAGLLMPGLGSGGGPGDASGDGPAVSLTSGFSTPFGDGFAWAVPGLVLSMPGLLLVLLVIGAQALGAFAWLPVVRRRIGAFGIRPGAAGRRGTGSGGRRDA